MDERKHAMIIATVPNDAAYAAAMRPVQAEALAS
jgi:hypothetical protein